MARALGGRVDDVHDPRGAELAEAEPEVERGADDGDDVGLVERGAPGPGEGERVAGRQRAAAHAVGEDRDLQRLGGGTQFGDRVAAPHVGASDDDRALGRGQQLGGPGDVLGVGLDDRDLGSAGRGDVLAGEEDLERQVEEGRAAVRGQGRGQRPRHLGGDLVGAGDRGGVLGDGRDERDVVDLLEAAGAPAEGRRPATHHQHRRGVEEGAGQARYAVGHAGTGGEDGQARAAL
nr:hypothetical protein GCM10020092_016250 [Actinoplanes digitatis]